MTLIHTEGWQTITDLNRWHSIVDSIERWLRPMFRRHSKLGGPAYFDNKDFPITQKLEENYFLIRGEFDQVRERLQDFPLFQDISPEQTYISDDDKWRMFFLKANNVRFERNCELFPKTMEVVDSDKNLVSAYFSILDSNKMLVPHEGPWSGVLRMHLGIDIPTDGQGCVLSVMGEEYRWRNGKAVVFDDTYEHFAINLTDNIRVVLFIDYLRPLPLPLHWLNKFCVYIGRFLPYYKIPIQRHRAWERRFYGEDGIPAKQYSAL